MSKRQLSLLRLAILLSFIQYATLAFPSEAPRPNDTYNFTIGGNPNAASFVVPKKYNPEIREAYFRLLVYYPSMTPALKSQLYTKESRILDIVVMPYPPGGSEVDNLLSGRFGAKKIGVENGMDLFSEPIGKNSRLFVYGFRSQKDDYVAVTDLGAISVKYKMSFSNKDKYEVRCFFGKDVESSFPKMHETVSSFIESLQLQK